MSVPGRSIRGRVAGAVSAFSSVQRADDGGHGEQDVDEHDPAPVQELRQRAAEDQADGRAGAGDHAEDAERAVALRRDGEGGGEEAERGRGEQCGERSLQRAGGDEHAEALGHAAERGRHGEAGEPDDEHALATEVVAEAPAEQQQAAECERVRGDDPLPGVVGEAQRLLRRGKGDVHDRRVEHDHQLGEPDQREDPPAVGLGGGVGGGGHCVCS